MFPNRVRDWPRAETVSQNESEEYLSEESKYTITDPITDIYNSSYQKLALFWGI
jgi:hypothetical protein